MIALCLPKTAWALSLGPGQRGGGRGRRGGIPLRRRRHFVCSQFVAHVLRQSGLWPLEKEVSLARPQDFAALPGARLVYQGRLNDYRAPARLLSLPALPRHLSA